MATPSGCGAVARLIYRYARYGVGGFGSRRFFCVRMSDIVVAGDCVLQSASPWRRNMLRVILTVLAGLSASTATAANWHFVSAAADNSSLVYIDMDTLNSDGRIKTVWVKHDNSAPDAAGVVRVLSRATYDCDARTYNLLAYVIEGEGGAIMDHGEVPTERQAPEALVAGSEGEKTLTYLCGGGRKI